MNAERIKGMPGDSDMVSARDLVLQYGRLDAIVNAAVGTCEAMLLASARLDDGIDDAELSAMFWKSHLDAGDLEAFFEDGVQVNECSRFGKRMAEARVDMSLEPVRFLNVFASSYSKAGIEFARRVLQIADDSLAPVLETIDNLRLLNPPIPPRGASKDYDGEPYIVPLTEHFNTHPSLVGLVRKQLAGAAFAVRVEFGVHEPRQLERALQELYAGIELELLRACKLIEQSSQKARMPIAEK